MGIGGIVIDIIVIRDYLLISYNINNDLIPFLFIIFVEEYIFTFIHIFVSRLVLDHLYVVFLLVFLLLITHARMTVTLIVTLADGSLFIDIDVVIDIDGFIRFVFFRVSAILILFLKIWGLILVLIYTLF